jgi:hypothetical protein
MSRFSLGSAILFVLLLVGGSGCGKRPASLVPVAGKVQLGGKPVKNATIQFVPDPQTNKDGFPATSLTGEDGSFKLQTPPYGDGAAPGAYKVIVLGYPGKAVIPEKYTRIDKTLSVEIKPGGDDKLLIKLD